MSHLRIDKGSLGAAVLLDTNIHHYTSCVGLFGILWKRIFFSIQ